MSDSEIAPEIAPVLAELDGDFEVYTMPNGEVVELYAGGIFSIRNEDGELIKEPTPPKQPKPSTVAGPFKVVDRSINLRDE